MAVAEEFAIAALFPELFPDEEDHREDHGEAAGVLGADKSEDAGPPFRSLEDLADYRQHVAWREELIKSKDGNERATKVPYNACREGKASSANPKTWGTLVEAQTRAEHLLKKGAKGGVGIVLGPIRGHDTLCLGGIDLDTCLDPNDSIADWARQVIDRFKFIHRGLSQ